MISQYILNFVIVSNTLLVLWFYSGTTWVQEIVWQIHNEGAISSENILKRVPFLERATNEKFPLPDLKTLSSPNLIKSHHPYSATPKSSSNDACAQCKYIYIARNPKDVAASYFHFVKRVSENGKYDGPWEFFLKLFMEGIGKFV